MARDSRNGDRMLLSIATAKFEALEQMARSAPRRRRKRLVIEWLSAALRRT